MADGQASADTASGATPAPATPTEGLTDEGREAIRAAMAAQRPEPEVVPDPADAEPDDDAVVDGADPGDETPDDATTAPAEDVIGKIPERALKAAREVWSDETIRDLYAADPDAFIRKANRYAEADEYVQRRMSNLPPKDKGGDAEAKAETPKPKYELPNLDELAKEYEEDFGLDEATAKRRAQREINRQRPIIEEANRAAERERQAFEQTKNAEAERMVQTIEAEAERTFGAVDPDGVVYGKGASATVTGEHLKARQQMATVSKLLVDGLRANGMGGEEAVKWAAQIADQSVRFPHLQNTERQAVKKQVESRSKQRTIPPGATANGTRSNRKVRVGHHGDELPKESWDAIQKAYDDTRSARA